MLVQHNGMAPIKLLNQFWFILNAFKRIIRLYVEFHCYVQHFQPGQ
jgi:hypothetical protein